MCSKVRIPTSLRTPPLISIQINSVQTQNRRCVSQFKLRKYTFQILLLLWTPSRRMLLANKLLTQRATWMRKWWERTARKFLVRPTSNRYLAKFIRIQQPLQVRLKLPVLRTKTHFCNEVFIRQVRSWTAMDYKTLLIKKYATMLIIF
jgi:hypothetical protein